MAKNILTLHYSCNFSSGVLARAANTSQPRLVPRLGAFGQAERRLPGRPGRRVPEGGAEAGIHLLHPIWYVAEFASWIRWMAARFFTLSLLFLHKIELGSRLDPCCLHSWRRTRVWGQHPAQFQHPNAAHHPRDRKQHQSMRRRISKSLKSNNSSSSSSSARTVSSEVKSWWPSAAHAQVHSKFRFPFYYEMCWYVLERYLHCLTRHSYLKQEIHKEPVAVGKFSPWTSNYPTTSALYFPVISLLSLPLLNMNQMQNYTNNV